MLQAAPATLCKKETLAQVFFCEFCEISKNTLFYRTSLVAASVCLQNIPFQPYFMLNMFSKIEYGWWSLDLRDHHTNKNLIKEIWLCVIIRNCERASGKKTLDLIRISCLSLNLFSYFPASNYAYFMLILSVYAYKNGSNNYYYVVQF